MPANSNVKPLYVSQPANARYHIVKKLINILGLKSGINVNIKVLVKKSCKIKNISTNSMVHADKIKFSAINK